jgi:hypothetical protein
MLSKEFQFKKDYLEVITAYQAAFPDITPPEPGWIFNWLSKYPTSAIKDAIQDLQKHSPEVRARFTTTSTGKAISSLLRSDALNRAIADVQASGGSKSK